MMKMWVNLASIILLDIICVVRSPTQNIFEHSLDQQKQQVLRLVIKLRQVSLDQVELEHNVLAKMDFP